MSLSKRREEIEIYAHEILCREPPTHFLATTKGGGTWTSSYMAPPKKGELIKGQASLANFFSGGGLTPVPVKEKKKASEEREKDVSSPKGKKSENKNRGGSSLSQQEVTEVKEKVRIN